jgi:hypothetical protein
MFLRKDATKNKVIRGAELIRITTIYAKIAVIKELLIVSSFFVFITLLRTYCSL